MNIIDRLFKSNNETYTRAKVRLNKVKESLNDLTLAFPDITPYEIAFIENTWNELPSDIAEGVSIMALKLEFACKTLLTHYSPNSFLQGGESNNFLQLNKVIRGSITNNMTGECYKAGDTFVLGYNEMHYLSSEEDSYVYTVITNEDINLDVLTVNPEVFNYVEEFHM